MSKTMRDYTVSISVSTTITAESEAEAVNLAVGAVNKDFEDNGEAGVFFNNLYIDEVYPEPTKEEVKRGVGWLAP